MAIRSALLLGRQRGAGLANLIFGCDLCTFDFIAGSPLLYAHFELIPDDHV